MKDANDLLLEGKLVTDVPTEPIDLFCCREVLARYPDDKQAQYKAVDKFFRTIQNELIKSDVAQFLAEAWSKDIQEIRKQLSINTETEDEQVDDFQDIDSCLGSLNSTLDKVEIGVGYKEIDENAIFRKKDVVIVGAYSFSGKTDNLIQWILYWCVKLKLRVLFFSLEMPKEDVAVVIVGKVIGMPPYQVRQYLKTPEGADVYRKVSEKIGKYLYIIDKNSVSIDDIDKYVKIANRRIFKDQVDVVCVDYYQYLKGITGYENDSNTARRMKEVAKDNNVAFVMLSQITKESQKSDKGVVREPTMNDLKGAGDIVASGDLIYMMWRPYLMGNMSQIDAEKVKYETRIKIAKVRGSLRKGQETRFTLLYNPETGRLGDCSF